MKAENSDGISFEEFFEELFDHQKARNVVQKFRDEPPPRRLFGEMWHEGELAVMFGEASVGKSILATQIGISLAGGEAFCPLAVDGLPRRVLYLDLKLSDRQFAMRYSPAADEPSDEERLGAGLPATFDRAAVRCHARLPRGYTSLTQPLARAVDKIVRLKKPQVVIFDAVTRLKHSNDVTRDLIPIMRELRRISRETGVSMLMLAQSEPRAWSPRLAAGDLRSAAVICNYADSVFAVGRSQKEGWRYVKHLRSGSGEIIYDSTHTPVFFIEKNEADGMTGFAFREFATEDTAMGAGHEHRQGQHIDRAHELHLAGRSLADIGRELGVSKTTAHRWVQSWKPPAQRCRDDHRWICAAHHSHLGVSEAAHDPDVTPGPHEEVLADTASEDEAGRGPDELEAEPAGYEDEFMVPDGWPGAASEGDDEPREPEAEPEIDGIPISRLVHTTDDNGNEVWVREFEPDGRFRIWYKYTSRGELRRWVRKAGGCNGEPLTKPP